MITQMLKFMRVGAPSVCLSLLSLIILTSCGKDKAAEIQALEDKQIQTEEALEAAKVDVTKLENQLQDCKNNVEKLQGSIAALSGASSSNTDAVKTEYYCEGVPVIFSKGVLEHFKILKSAEERGQCQIQLMTLVVPREFDRYIVEQFDQDEVSIDEDSMYWSTQVERNAPGKKWQLEFYVEKNAKRINFSYLKSNL